MPPLDEQRIHAVLQLDRQGMKWRAIARALHISRNTVRQIVREHAAGPAKPALGAADAAIMPTRIEARSFSGANRRAACGSTRTSPRNASSSACARRASTAATPWSRIWCAASAPRRTPAEPGDRAARARGHGRVRLVAVPGHLHPCRRP